MSEIILGKEKIELKESILKIEQENINEFLGNYASWYNYYYNKLADAAYVVKRYNNNYSTTYSTKFRYYKVENGCSDKLAEAMAKADAELIEIQDKINHAEYVHDIIKGFLRSMDYAHDNAKEMCYNMRKEIDKLYTKTISRTEQKLDQMFNGE